MTHTELRAMLLKQHAEIRALAAGVMAASETELRERLAELVSAIDAHNAFEERELHAILPDIDAWGEIRDHRVGEHHDAEHAAIQAGLRSADSIRALAAALAVLEDHMVREERELLSTDVLRDDIITTGIGG